jgi:DNA-binding transcriptional LysR family regulator
MTNIPSELLRTFVCLVELRSYTKTAARLQLSQPSISNHVKRIQELMGGGLFDKSGPGIALTKRGAMVAAYARKILDLNDELFDKVNEPTISRIRIGVPDSCTGRLMSSIVAGLRERIPSHGLVIVCEHPEILIRQMHESVLDVAFVRTTAEPTDHPRHCWREEMAWACSPSLVRVSEIRDPVPLVINSGVLGLDDLVQSSLRQADRTSYVAFEAADPVVLGAAVFAGVGVMPAARRIVSNSLPILPDGTLPPLPDIFGSIYIRNNDDILGAIADEFAAAERKGGTSGMPFADSVAAPDCSGREWQVALSLAKQSPAVPPVIDPHNGVPLG